MSQFCRTLSIEKQKSNTLIAGWYFAIQLLVYPTVGLKKPKTLTIPTSHWDSELSSVWDNWSALWSRSNEADIIAGQEKPASACFHVPRCQLESSAAALHLTAATPAASSTPERRPHLSVTVCFPVLRAVCRRGQTIQASALCLAPVLWGMDHLNVIAE